MYAPPSIVCIQDSEGLSALHAAASMGIYQQYVYYYNTTLLLQTSVTAMAETFCILQQ